jgi:uncharacterized Rmd1/YagE family protein
MSAEENDEWDVHGEVPSTDPLWLHEPSEEHFKNRANTLNRRMAHGHEVATIIKDKLVAVYSENEEMIVKVSAAALTVAGVLLATKELRRRRKK